MPASTAPTSRNPSDDLGTSLRTDTINLDSIGHQGESPQTQTVTWVEPRPVSRDSIASAGLPMPSEAAATSRYLSVNSDPEGDMPREVVFTPDGASVIVVNRDTDNLVIFDADTRTVTATIPVGDNPVDVAVSPDGQYAVVPNLHGNTVSIVDLAGQSVAAHVPVTGSRPYRVAVTADGAYAVVGVINDAVNSSFSVISLSTLTEVRSFPSAPQRGYGAFLDFDRSIYGTTFSQFAVSSDNVIVLPDRYNDRVWLYDAETGTELASLSTMNYPTAVDISPDGTVAVVSNEGSTGGVTKIDLVTQAITGEFSPISNVYDHLIRITPDKTHAIVGVSNYVVFVDLATGETTATVYTGMAGDIEISYDGKYAFVSNLYDPWSSVIDIASQTRLTTLTLAPCAEAAVSPVDYRVVALNNRRGENVHFYSIDGAASAVEGIVFSGTIPEADSPSTLAVAGAGPTLVVGNRTSGNVSIIDLDTETVRAYVDTGIEVTGLATTPDGAYAVVANGDSDTVSILDLSSDAVVATLPASETPYNVVISPDSQTAYVGSVDGTDRVHFIQLAGAASSVVGTLATGQIGQMALTPDGSILGIYNHYDGEFVLVDTATRTEIARVSLTSGGFSNKVTFSPDGSRAYVTNYYGNSVFVVDIDGPASHLVTTIGGTSFARTVNVDAAGEFVYVGGIQGDDDTPAIYVIDAATNSVVQTVSLSSSWMYSQEAYLSQADSVLYVTARLTLIGTYGREGTQALYRVSAEGASSWLIDATPLTDDPAGLVFSENLKTAAIAMPIPDGVDIVDFHAAPGTHAVILSPGERETGVNFGNKSQLQLDFGDAPDTGTGTGPGNYNTLAADNGPSHVIVADLYMGSTVDAELDGQPTVPADGDDLNGVPDDEDGLVNPAVDLSLAVGGVPSVDVKVTNNTGSTAMLYGWIDYNGNGVFEASERDSAPVLTGSIDATVTLIFPLVPSGSVASTYARFRLSTDQAAAEQPTGPANDGEVEDYTVSIDEAPRVTNVWVSSGSWTQSFLDELAALGVGDATHGYAIPVGSSDQLDPLPWFNIDQVAIQFSENVVVSQDDLDLWGVTVLQYGYVPDPDFYDDVTYVATWTLDRQIDRPDKLLIDLGGVTDTASIALDGEWTNEVSTYPSGNDAPGGDFQFRFNVLPGDADQSGWVLTNDWRDIRAKLFALPVDPAYSIFHDVDGSGWILTDDWRDARGRLFDQLPPGEPSPLLSVPAGMFGDRYASDLALALVLDRQADRVDPWNDRFGRSVWNEALLRVAKDLEPHNEDEKVELPGTLLPAYLDFTLLE